MWVLSFNMGKRLKGKMEPSPIKYQGTNIVIEQRPLPTRTRLIFGAVSLLFLAIGLKGCFELVRMLLGFGTGYENIAAGLFITLSFLAVSGFVFWLMLDSGRKLTLDPQMRLAYLTKHTPFKTTNKQFAYKSLPLAEIRQDADMESVWSWRLKLPDRTLFDLCHDDGKGYKQFAQKWRDKVNGMISGESI